MRPLYLLIVFILECTMCFNLQPKNNIPLNSANFLRSPFVPNQYFYKTFRHQPQYRTNSHCINPNGRFPMPGDCSSYILCIDGVGCLKECVSGMHFHPNLLMCTPQHLSSCNSKLNFFKNIPRPMRCLPESQQTYREDEHSSNEQSSSSEEHVSPMEWENVSSMGHGNVSPTGQGNVSPMGQGNVSPMGQENVSPMGQGNMSPMGQENVSPMGQGNVSPMGQGNVSPMGHGNVSPMGQGNVSPMGQGNLSPMGQENVSVFGQETHCPKPEGLFPLTGDCSSFISCANGFGCRMKCGPGTLYHSKLQVCTHPHMSDCQSKIKNARYNVGLPRLCSEIAAGGGADNSNSNNNMRPTHPSVITSNPIQIITQSPTEYPNTPSTSTLRPLVIHQNTNKPIIVPTLMPTTTTEAHLTQEQHSSTQTPSIFPQTNPWWATSSTSPPTWTTAKPCHCNNSNHETHSQISTGTSTSSGMEPGNAVSNIISVQTTESYKPSTEQNEIVFPGNIPQVIAISTETNVVAGNNEVIQEIGQIGSVGNNEISSVNINEIGQIGSGSVSQQPITQAPDLGSNKGETTVAYQNIGTNEGSSSSQGNSQGSEGTVSQISIDAIGTMPLMIPGTGTSNSDTITPISNVVSQIQEIVNLEEIWPGSGNVQQKPHTGNPLGQTCSHGTHAHNQNTPSNQPNSIGGLLHNIGISGTSEGGGDTIAIIIGHIGSIGSPPHESNNGSKCPLWFLPGFNCHSMKASSNIKQNIKQNPYKNVVSRSPQDPPTLYFWPQLQTPSKTDKSPHQVHYVSPSQG